MVRRSTALATLMVPMLAIDAFAPFPAPVTRLVTSRRTLQSSVCAVASFSAAADLAATESSALSRAEEAARAAVEASLAEGRAEDAARQAAGGTAAGGSGSVPPTIAAASNAHDFDPKIRKLMEEARSIEATRTLRKAEKEARSAVVASLAETAARLSDSDSETDSANDRRESNFVRGESNAVTASDSLHEPEQPRPSTEFSSTPTPPKPSSFLDSATPTVAFESFTASSFALREAEKAARLRVAALAAAEAAASLKGQGARKRMPTEAITSHEGTLLGSRWLCLSFVRW